MINSDRILQVPADRDLISDLSAFPNESLREGPRDIDLGTRFLHPVQALQEQQWRSERAAKAKALQAVHGIHAPFRDRMEVAACATARRLPGLRSSFLSLDIALGTEDTLTFQDLLAVDDPSKMAASNLTLHDRVERYIAG